ncbi:peptidoglycan-binding protein, partial [Candidatus Entotheonella palauensis]|uniref:peptidoglycan-binding protein n=1 Tax=Candidatus Entotheonella palauensis TaxID=93172 RepID=UPI0015C42649
MSFVSPLRAGEPPVTPFLRIETGMHTAPIRRIGVDAANRYLVTASHDKTLRVWELATGKLLSTLRVPIGMGDEGKLYAVAISPDGETVAGTGWTGLDWDGEASIYLFNRVSSRLIRRIGGLPNTIRHLTYSKDGRYLAATLGGANGVRIFRTSDYQLAAQDMDYEDGSYWADFDRRSRLVTVSGDGFVRLYDNRFDLIAKARAPGGTQPFSASFSPDGSKIAIGFVDSTKVNVLSGEDLRLLYSPDSQEVTNGHIVIVAWSTDGRFLYAGGRYYNSSGYPILKWDRSGRGDVIELAAADNTVLHILPLNNGGLVYGTTDPAFGVFNRMDHKVIDIRADNADFRNNVNGFLISHDGTTVQFGFESRGKRPAQFSIEQRALTPITSDSSEDLATIQRRLADQGFDPGPVDGLMGPRTKKAIRRFQRQNGLTVSGKISDRLKQALGLPQLTAPITQRPGLEITNWYDQNSPTLNGEALALDNGDLSRSLAIAPTGQHFLLGTEWSLRLFDRQGTQQWRIAAPGVAWDVNITGDGRLAVAAFGDGTIRWFQLTDGKELLAFFPHKDGKRRVVWTPEGFFDASEGGEALIGYHLNQGQDQAAEFVGVEQLYDLFYRPDLIAKRLEGGHEDAIQTALAKIGDVRQVLASGLPPTVELLGGAEVKHNSRHYTLNHAVIDRGGGIGRIVYRINGVEVSNATERRPGPKTPGRTLRKPPK